MPPRRRPATSLGRDKFIERVWQWRTDKGGTIIKQLKRMGASCDWDRERFTMDEGLSKAVREVFVRLFNEGLIYKGDYIVNWCPRCLTALADDEVEHDPTHGKLYHLRYPYADGSGSVVIATTRPETMLGDTAVAVHPDDERYAGLDKIGIRLPLVDLMRGWTTFATGASRGKSGGATASRREGAASNRRRTASESRKTAPKGR